MFRERKLDLLAVLARYHALYRERVLMSASFSVAVSLRAVNRAWKQSLFLSSNNFSQYFFFKSPSPVCAGCVYTHPLLAEIVNTTAFVRRSSRKRESCALHLFFRIIFSKFQIRTRKNFPAHSSGAESSEKRNTHAEQRIAVLKLPLRRSLNIPIRWNQNN
jgi:hypothetical protein